MLVATYKKECVAMLLAGGRGARLQVLTEHIAKPAVTVGGRYRIIDFTLTNCALSGIDTVGVLTQYLPMFLNDYIAKGQPWDLDLVSGGVFILSPYSSGDRSDWYSGSANSVYQNSRFIESYSPSYVLVLGGDHVYKMDYSEMLAYHKQMNAECTIAVIEVPLVEASRFGIMNVDKENRIVEFEEKPANPRSNLASMGIYIFNWPLLKERLELDSQNPDSDSDFGKNIIPGLLAAGARMFAYRFSGYWKDVGTVESLWEANMDILRDPTLGRPQWLVQTRIQGRPPHQIAASGQVRNSLVSSDCYIAGTVENSVLSNGVYIAEGAVVKNSVVMSDVRINSGAVVEYAILDERCVISAGSVIGKSREHGGELTVVPGVWVQEV